jgi:hypothetical protein
VVVVELLVELDGVELVSLLLVPVPLEPGAPIELVLPDEPLVLPGVVLLPPIALLLLPGVVVPPPIALLLLPGVLLPEVAEPLLGEGVVVDELDEDVPGAEPSVPVRFVQAPSETAATSASAAHAVSDVFIRKLLEGLFESRQGTMGCP